MRDATLAVMIVTSLPSLMAQPQDPRAGCLMSLPRPVIEIPATGFTDVDDPQLSGCDEMPTEWLRGPLRAGKLTVNPSGPEGSGRYWSITIGLAPARDAAPTRGVCLETSTAGFRSLRSFGNGALPWLADRDRDGVSEAVIWTSFFLTPRFEQSETGLVAWVYRVDAAAASLTLDWTLSRDLAREIAAAYRQPMSAQQMKSAPTLLGDRQIAADALDRFASGRCEVRQEQHQRK